MPSLLLRGVIGQCSLPTAAAENARPIRAVMAFTRFHCFGSSRSIIRMPSANSVSSSIGKASR